MQATRRTITQLFEPTHRYVVPMFQRHYVWSRTEQWEPLWDDIKEKLEARESGSPVSPHFLGAVILDSPRRTSSRELSRLIVIDGQQRLTTFQILLTAFRDVANNRELPPLANAAERCLLNPDVEIMERPDEEKYKLWPTLVNRAAFCQIISAGSPQKVREFFPVIRLPRKRKPEPRERLAEAYEYFFEKIEQVCSVCELPEKVKDSLLTFNDVLRYDFTVVEIMLGESDNSQEIFNSLNARGKPLNQSDLLRSYIFMRAEKNEAERDRLFDTYWSQFENKWWSEETKRGNQISSKLDTLTRTLLSAKLGKLIDVKRVHLAYTDWIRSNNPYSNIEDELRDFVSYGTYFEQLNGKVQGVLSTFGSRMNTWDTKTIFPLAIYLAAESALSEQDLTLALTYLESFIVRRAVCGLQTKEYNKFFIEIIARMREGSATGQTLLDLLLAGQGETRRFPDDSEFADSWKTKPVYNRLTSAQLTLMLRQLEKVIRSHRAEATSIPNGSVEHIMPQQWTTNYQLAGEPIPSNMNRDWFFGYKEGEQEMYDRLKPLIERRRRLINTIGNLTLVTQSLNSAMSNVSFTEKKQYLRESVLTLNRYFDQISEWDETAIESRAEQLFHHARVVWSRPSAS